MVVQRPDKGFAWVVVFSCAYINFAFFGLFRSAGVLYVSLINEYGITREEASWPFTLCSAIFQLIGPFVSVIVQFTTLRKLALLGSVIATSGVICCYFATSIVWVNVSYGVIHGIGFGMVVIATPVIINQYFIRHRATAMGCSFAGSTLSSFVLPPLIEYLQQEYELRGTFLILSGFTMNTIVASCFLRAPTWSKKNSAGKGNQLVEATIEDKDSGLSSSEGGSCKDHPFELNDPPDEYDDEMRCRSDEGISEACESLLTERNEQSKDGAEDGAIEELKQQNEQMYDFKTEQDLENETMLVNKEKQIVIIPQKKMVTKPNVKSWSYIGKSVLETVTHPMFAILTISTVVFFLNSFTLFIVIVDFAKDKGIPEFDAIYLLPVFSLTDLVGRMGLGWITDGNFISRKKMFVTDIAMIGILCLCYPHCYHFVSFSVVLMFHGLAMGSGLTLIYVLQAEYFGLDNQIYFCGLGGLMGGLTTLSRPPLIGIFRDYIGSYDWMFRFFGMLCLVMASVWLIQPHVRCKNNQRTKFCDVESNTVNKEHA